MGEMLGHMRPVSWTDIIKRVLTYSVVDGTEFAV